jgi:hypothetical protein
MAATITSIIGLQNLPNLQEFSADNNSLTTVDLSGLINLSVVDVSDNNFPGTSTNSLSSVNLTGCSYVDVLRLDDSDFSTGVPDISDLIALTNLDYDQCNISGNIDISYSTVLQFVDLSGNTNLTSVTITDAQPILTLFLSNCALTEQAVDDVLVTLSNNGQSNGVVNLDGGTNAIPSATGLAAKLVLEGNSWVVNVNS